MENGLNQITEDSLLTWARRLASMRDLKVLKHGNRGDYEVLRLPVGIDGKLGEYVVYDPTTQFGRFRLVRVQPIDIAWLPGMREVARKAVEGGEVSP